MKAVDALQKLFPHKKVVSFSLKKSNTEARDNALHLDCCFQPVGKDKAIIYKGGFLNEEEYNWLVNLFGKENIFEITQEEMYNMNSNIFSISEGSGYFGKKLHPVEHMVKGTKHYSGRGSLC